MPFSACRPRLRRRHAGPPLPTGSKGARQPLPCFAAASQHPEEQLRPRSRGQNERCTVCRVAACGVGMQGPRRETMTCARTRFLAPSSRSRSRSCFFFSLRTRCTRNTRRQCAAPLSLSHARASARNLRAVIHPVPLFLARRAYVVVGNGARRPLLLWHAARALDFVPNFGVPLFWCPLMFGDIRRFAALIGCDRPAQPACRVFPHAECLMSFVWSCG